MIWKILPKKSEDLTEQLLINRGIKTQKEKEQFYSPKLSEFEKDLHIPGIEKANKRILKAIESGEQMLVFGDYDVDGICGCAILYKGLTSLNAKVLPYIPHREKEGYGLSKLGLEFARDCGATLVITVDNGITAINQAKFAKKLGLDLIITDHHLPEKEKPDAHEIVHSTKMCGAAVAWCLIRKLVKQDLKKELLQFVAVATVCDLLPLLGLGRAFLVEGLKVLNQTTNIGFLSLTAECGINLRDIGSYEIGHIIGPRLNSMGRLEHAIDSLRLLCTKDAIKAKRLAKLLCETNATRQQMTTDAMIDARALVVKENSLRGASNIHVLYSPKWSSGIIGLIAGKITEEFSTPVVAISVGEKVSKGSARSINGLNIVEIIRRHSDILIDVGGHPGAAGFSILTQNLEIFKKRLEKEDIILPQSQVLEVDAELQTKQLTKSLVGELQRFEPFGFQNPRPIFATYKIGISDIRTVGQARLPKTGTVGQGKHLKFKAEGLDAIAFGMGDLESMLQNGQQVDLAYNLELDTYNGFEKLQLKVKDLKLN